MSDKNTQRNARRLVIAVGIVAWVVVAGLMLWTFLSPNPCASWMFKLTLTCRVLGA